MLARPPPSSDLILASGGVSTGEADLVKAAVESVGTLVFWRVAIKPGRPVAMGVISGTAFIGLPGNPVASFVTFVHIARPPSWRCRRTAPAADFAARARRLFLPEEGRATRICARSACVRRRMAQ